MQAKTASRSIQSQFQIVPIDGTKVAFRNVLGNFLCAEPDGTFNWNRNSVGAWEEFTMEKHQKTKTAFKTFHSDYISVTEEGSLLRGIKAVGSEQLFEIEEMCKTGNA